MLKNGVSEFKNVRLLENPSQRSRGNGVVLKKNSEQKLDSGSGWGLFAVAERSEVVGSIQRGLASLHTGQKNVRVPVPARVQLLRVCAFGKSLDIFYKSGCPLTLKNFK